MTTKASFSLTPVRTTVLTENVTQRLAPEQIGEAMKSLHQRLPQPDLDNPGLWVIYVDDIELWALLDSGAGQFGEDVVTVIFPEDY